MEEENYFPENQASRENIDSSKAPKGTVSIEDKLLRKWMIRNMITETAINELLGILKGGFNVESVAKNAKKLIAVDNHLFQEIVCYSINSAFCEINFFSLWYSQFCQMEEF